MKKWIVLGLAFCNIFNTSHAMWAGARSAARQLVNPIPRATSNLKTAARTLSVSTPKQLENIRDLGGLHAPFEKRPEISPLLAAAYVNSGALTESYRAESATAATPAAKVLFNELNEEMRTSVAPGNPISSLEGKDIGTFIDILTQPNFDLTSFLKSEFVKKWYEKHHEKTGRYSKQKGFNQQIKNIVNALKKAPTQDRDNLLASLLYLKSATAADLLEAAAPLTGIAPTSGVIVQPLNQQDITAAQELLDNNQIDPNALSSKQLEQIVYLALSQQNGGTLEALNVSFSYANYNGRRIPPCTECSLRTFVQSILYNPETNKLSFENLQNINPLPEFAAFIEKHNNPQKSGYYKNSQDEWLELVSNQPDIAYLQTDTEMAGQMENSLAMLNLLFGTNAETLDTFAQFVSTPQTQILVTPGNQTYGQYKVKVQFRKTELGGKWFFSSGHVSYKLETPETVKLSLNQIFTMGKIGEASSLNLVSLISKAKIKEAMQWGITDVIEKVDNVEDLKIGLAHLNIDIATFLFEDESNFLHKVISTERHDLIEGLVKIGVSTEQKNHGGLTPLVLAIDENKIAMAEKLVLAGVDINATDIYNKTLLHYASDSLMSPFRRNKIRAIGNLVSLGANINISINGGNAPLHEAAESYGDDPSLLNHLITLGADIEQPGHLGKKPLHCATEEGNKKIVKVLVKAGATINSKRADKKTPLHEAADSQFDRIDMMELLVSLGADVNARDKYGQTPLHTASNYGRIEHIKFLVENLGANINARNEYGQTPLHKAAIAIWKKNKAVELLVSLGANVNAQDQQGNTPLHEATNHYELESSVIFLLIDLGADVNAQNKYGKTPLDLAMECKDEGDKKEYAISVLRGLGAVTKEKLNEKTLYEKSKKLFFGSYS